MKGLLCLLLVYLSYQVRVAEGVPVDQLVLDPGIYHYVVRIWVGSFKPGSGGNNTIVGENDYEYSCLGVLMNENKIFTSGYCIPCQDDKSDVFIHSKAGLIFLKHADGLTYEYCVDKDHPEEGKKVGAINLFATSIPINEYARFAMMTNDSKCQVLYLGEKGVLGEEEATFENNKGTCRDDLICVTAGKLETDNLDPGSPLVCEKKVIGIYDYEMGKKMKGKVLPFVRLNMDPVCTCLKKEYGDQELTCMTYSNSTESAGVNLNGNSFVLVSLVAAMTLRGMVTSQ